MGRVRVIVLALAGVLLAVGLAMVAFYEKRKYVPDPTKARQAKKKKAEQRRKDEFEEDLDFEIENYGTEEIQNSEHPDKS